MLASLLFLQRAGACYRAFQLPTTHVLHSGMTKGRLCYARAPWPPTVSHHHSEPQHFKTVRREGGTGSMYTQLGLAPAKDV